MARPTKEKSKSVMEQLWEIPSLFMTPITTTCVLKYGSRQKTRWVALALSFNLLMCLYLWPIYHGPRVAELQRLATADRGYHGALRGHHGNDLNIGYNNHGNGTNGYRESEEDDVDVKFSYHGNLVARQNISVEDSGEDFPDQQMVLTPKDGGTNADQSQEPRNRGLIYTGGEKSGDINADGRDLVHDGDAMNLQNHFDQQGGKAQVDKPGDGINELAPNIAKERTVVKMHQNRTFKGEDIQSKMNVKTNGSRNDKLQFVNQNPVSQDLLSFVRTPYECDQNLYLLVVVCSAVQNLHLRAAIRDTWGSAQNRRHLGMRIVFLLGQPTDQFAIMEESIRNESSKFGDIIQGSFVDHYSNLSIKSIGYLKWAKDNCPGTQFVMKTDDDIFINVPNLLEELNNLSTNNQHRKIILGNIIEGAEPILDRNSKWYTPPSVFNQKTYPNYASGIAYVMSGDLVAPLYEAARKTKLFWLEDIYITGMLTKDLGVTLLHNPRFAYVKRKLSPCAYRLGITGHELSDKEMYKVWWDIHRSDIDCSSSSLHFNKADFLAHL